MRILIATGIFKPEVGGPATVAFELAKKLQATGHSVTVITYSDKPYFDGDKDMLFRLIRVERSQYKLINYLRYFSVVLREIRKHTVAYTLDWFSGGLPVMLASKLTGKKYIVRVGGGYLWEKYLAEGRPPLTLRQFYAQGLHKEYKLMFFVIKKVLQNAERVIFNSDIQRELYIPIYDLHPQKTLTIYNAIPENKLSGLVQSYNADFFERDKEIVFAGRFIKMKNIESLVRAFAKLEDKSFRLLLIGSGPLDADIRILTDALGLSASVEFLPTMSQSDLYYRIASCYLVVIPSWTDVSPNQVYECLALGIPFLISKENYLSISAQLPMQIDPGSVDDIAAKLNALLDPAAYRQFVGQEKSIAFDHPWDKVVEEHLKVFMNLNNRL